MSSVLTFCKVMEGDFNESHGKTVRLGKPGPILVIFILMLAKIEDQGVLNVRMDSVGYGVTPIFTIFVFC